MEFVLQNYRLILEEFGILVKQNSKIRNVIEEKVEMYLDSHNNSETREWRHDSDKQIVSKLVKSLFKLGKNLQLC